MNIHKQTLLLIGLICSLAAISFAQTEAEPRKVSYGFVVDNSGSMRLRLDRIIRIVGDLISLNRAEDNTFLVTFVDSENISVMQEMTSDIDQIRDEAENMFVRGGQTAILDAVKLSADYLAENSPKTDTRVRILVLITDGDERQSRTKFADVIELLKKEEIAVFIIGIGDQKVETKLIDRLAKESGGKRYLPVTSDQFEELIPQLAGDLRK